MSRHGKPYSATSINAGSRAVLSCRDLVHAHVSGAVPIHEHCVNITSWVKLDRTLRWNVQICYRLPPPPPGAWNARTVSCIRKKPREFRLSDDLSEISILAEISPESQVVFFFFSDLLQQFQIYFSKGKTPLGCSLKPMSSIWHRPAVNAWPLWDGGRLISPSASNWTRTLVITANSFSFSFFYFLGPLPVTVVFFIIFIFFLSPPLPPCREESSIWHLISWISVLLFPGWMWVDMCRSPLGE